MVELLVVALVGAVLLTAFTGFYVQEQRTFRHHQIEIETSQALRTVLEQMSRDLRVAGRNLTGTATPVGLAFANGTRVDFRLDANDDGDTSDPGESKEFRLNGTTVESCEAGNVNCGILGDFVSGLTLRYFNCSGGPLTAFPLSTVDLASVARVNIAVSVQRPVIGGAPVSRTETDSVRIRSKKCLPT